MQEINHAYLFPAKYNRQQLVARSLLLADPGKTRPFDIKPEGKTLVNLKGKKGYVYFFRYKLQKDDDWQIALSGPQPENLTEVSSDDELTSLTNEKLNNSNSVSEQFNEQLTRLILLQHKSAAHFFDGNKNMYGGYNDY